MPSRKSPSQRSLAGRLARALNDGGSHAGRVVSAAPVPVTPKSVPKGAPTGPVVIPVLHGDPDDLVEGMLWFNLDATC